MRKSFLFILLVVVCLWSGIGNAQPALTNIEFYVNGIQKNQASYGIVTIELIFDIPMNQLMDPTIHYGLVSDNYPLNLPANGTWENDLVWQGSFAVTGNVPSTNDGEYVFKIFGAESATNMAMDTTYSKNINNTSLLIGRSGELVVSADSLFYGNITSGKYKDLPLIVTNNSIVPLEITNITVDAPFYIVNNITSLTIPGTSNYTLTIRFLPTLRAKYQGDITIYSNDRRFETYSVYLKGSSQGPRMELSTTGPFNYGKVKPDSSAQRSFWIYNQPATDPILSDTLRISEISTNEPSFIVSVSQLKIAPGDSDTVKVTFRPLKYKNYEGYRLTILSNDERQPIRTILLNGDAGDETPPPSPANIQFTWNGFNGYSNADRLYICWDNPTDPSGIAEIWWKFSTTAQPPTSPEDTTQYGGRFMLASNQSCFYMPLLGKIPSGRWYCYIWLVDGYGNSGYLSAVRTYFKYDTTPPGKPIIINRSFPENRWFGQSNNYTFTIRLSNDPYLRSIDAYQVRWKFKSQPTSASNFSGNAILSSIQGNQASFFIPFNSDTLCGEHDLFIWLADSAGNSSADSTASTRFKFDMCAPQITRIAPNSQNIAEFGETFTDTLQITDHSLLDSTLVRYRFGGAIAEEPPVLLERIERTDQFVLQIPSAGVSRRGIEYKVLATDSLGHKSTWPTATNWFSIRTRMSGEGDFRMDMDGRPIPLVVGDDETFFQLFSIPYELDNNSIEDVLTDDLGPYDELVWRIFDYYLDSRDTTLWKEGKNVRPFALGRSYFLITRKPDVIVDSGPGVSRRTVVPDTLVLQEGWNLIATPFNFPVHRSSLSFINSSYPVSLRSYERGWDITDVMHPWKGYAIYATADKLEKATNSQIKLVIEPQAAPGRVYKKSTIPFTLQKDEWLIQVSAEAGKMRDKNNWLGYRAASSHGFDKLELAAPPVIGDYLQVSFVRPEWEQAVNHFSTDFRPEQNKDQVWEFEVVTNQPHKTVDLYFDFLGDISTSKQVVLFDEKLKIVKNLRNENNYSFRTAKGISRRLFKLIVGSEQFIQEQAQTISIVPNEFKLLQNYPNPFNPETFIRFDLPKPADVKIVIFDMKGRKVKTLLHNVRKDAGYHQVIWDAKNDYGRNVAAGIYIYKITNGTQTRSRKMIYLK